MGASITRCMQLGGPLLVALVVCLDPSAASAQRWEWPEKAENLKVLPEDTTPQQLRATMFEFTRALGVRCAHCHDDSKGSRLEQMDFASDVKEEKDISRIMMEMVQRINGDELPQVERPAEERIQVTCITCHRSNNRPIMLEDELAGVIAQEGVQAAVARYHELHERFKDGFAYDFRARTLNDLGYRLLGEGKVDDAIVIFKLNAEMYPDAWNVYDSLGEAYMTKGETERAIALYQRSLGLNPDNDNAVEMLRKLKGTASGGH